jgi:hypothetical protein
MTPTPSITHDRKFTHASAAVAYDLLIMRELKGCSDNLNSNLAVRAIK